MTEQKKTQSVWKSYRFPILLISSIIIGSIIGLVMGEKATVLKPFGDIFLNLMFTAIVPVSYTHLDVYKRQVVELFRFHPEILAGFFPVAFGVGDNGID